MRTYNNILTTTITLYACYTCDVQIHRFLVNTKKQTFHNFVVSRVTFRLFVRPLFIRLYINGHVDYIILIIIICTYQKRVVVVSFTWCLIRLINRVSGAQYAIVWCEKNKILLYSRLPIPK